MSQPDKFYVAIENRDRFNVAELLLAESRRLEQDALTRRRNSPVKAKLMEQAFRLHALSVRIMP